MTLILIIFIISSFLQISYWIFFGLKIKGIKEDKIPLSAPPTPVSIIICFKNEKENIEKYFSSWVNQLSKADELILVNDFSTDGSEELIKRLIGDQKNVRLIHPRTDLPGKKQALSDGVLAASHNRILLTDADCFLPDGWKDEMNNAFRRDTDFVLGYAPFYKRHGFLNIFQRFEAMLTAVQYFSYAAAGIPYMGVGRNMGFSKTIFNPDVYKDSKTISGDDDLLVNALATGDNVSLCIEKQAFVYSEAKTQWKAYFLQKLRHSSTSVAYRRIHQVLLGLYALSQMTVNVLLLILIFSPFWKMVLLVYALRMLIISTEMSAFSTFFKEELKLYWAPVLDLILSLYYLILGFLFFTRKSVSWN